MRKIVRVVVNRGECMGFLKLGRFFVFNLDFVVLKVLRCFYGDVWKMCGVCWWLMVDVEMVIFFFCVWVLDMRVCGVFCFLRRLV